VRCLGAVALGLLWSISCSNGSNKKRVPAPEAEAGMAGAPDASDSAGAAGSPESSAGKGGAPESSAGSAGAGDEAGAPAAGAASTECAPENCVGGACVLGQCLPTLTIAKDVNLSQEAVSLGRACAEAAAYSVANLSFDEATLATAPGAGCLAVEDEVLLINLQGTPAAHGNVGNWELLRVARVVAQTVQFSAPKARFYGSGPSNDSGLGVVAASQRVALIRVPRFGKLQIEAGVTVTADPWDGALGGVLALRAAELDLAGTISAAALGYRAGRWSEDDITCTHSVQTEAGESIAGLGSATTAANLGASGGLSAAVASFNSNTPIASSPGHAQAGQVGLNAAPRTSGVPGAVYGVADASQLTLGSGPGGALKCLVTPDIPATPGLQLNTTEQAGGIALVLADDLVVAATGAISAAPPDAQRDISFSGGYIYLRGTTLAIGSGRASALGSKGHGINGPTVNQSNQAGAGYVVLEAATVTGASTPPAQLLTPP
jgi:hypothetical protein